MLKRANPPDGSIFLQYFDKVQQMKNRKIHKEGFPVFLRNKISRRL